MNDFWKGFIQGCVEGCLEVLRKSIVYFVLFLIIGWLWVTVFGLGISLFVVVIGLAILVGLLG